MTNESLEQRARELLAAEYERENILEIPRLIRMPGEPLSNIEQRAIRAIIRALESTPAQGVELPDSEHVVYGATTFYGEKDLYTADQMRAYGQACASARTAPAEGAKPIGYVHPDTIKGLEAGLFAKAAFFAKPMPQVWADIPLYLHPATTAPVVGDAGYTTGHCNNNKKPGGCQLHNLHCGWPNCDRKLIDTARPAKDEGDADEFTNWGRAALLWVLYHHQGGSSSVGQPIRFALGMGADDPLSESQIADAKRFAARTVSRGDA